MNTIEALKRFKSLIEKKLEFHQIKWGGNMTFGEEISKAYIEILEELIAPLQISNDKSQNPESKPSPNHVISTSGNSSSS